MHRASREGFEGPDRPPLVLHNMHTPLDFNSVDFLGMLEVLGLQLNIHAYKSLKGFLVMSITVPLL